MKYLIFFANKFDKIVAKMFRSTGCSWALINEVLCWLQLFSKNSVVMETKLFLERKRQSFRFEYKTAYRIWIINLKNWRL